MSYSRVWFPDGKKIKPRPYRIYLQKTGSCFWSVNYARSKIHFLCSGNKLQIFKYPPFEGTLGIDTYRINFAHQKMGLQGNIAYLWIKEIIMILEHIYISVRKATSELRRCCRVNTSSENRRRKHNVVTTLVFSCSNDIGNTTLWQRCDNVTQRRDQNTTKT